jgi:hypothetical protein
MNTDNTQMLSQEWLALQAQFEQAERAGLLIKLVCIVFFGVGLLLRLKPGLAAVFVLIFWLQEGIFRTSQARLGQRILFVEAGLNQNAADCPAFALHSEWQKTRPGTLGLIREYANNALRPTVAFPYLALLLLDFGLLMSF